MRVPDRVFFLRVDVQVEQPRRQADITYCGHIDVEPLRLGFDHLDVNLVFVHPHGHQVLFVPDEHLLAIGLAVVGKQE